MTVTSLWSVLDQAGCGTFVGAADILEFHRTKCAAPQLVREHCFPALAVDLSIWICEALKSHHVAHNHVEPALHIVYSRTLKLLKLGVKLVVVIEGKYRSRCGIAGMVHRNEVRSGTRFWKACQKCEDMLRHLGVIVVRARGEGEALCALLNQKGIVDGVISNDGDCFLYGAKVLYTKFSIENLVNGRVVRFEAATLRARLKVNDLNLTELNLCIEMDHDSIEFVELTRDDLITFAIITGSDVTGNGLRRIGSEKALRFIKKCKVDSPLSPDDAAYQEILSWAKAMPSNANKIDHHLHTRCCSLCNHPGSKTNHLKDGCTECGTSPGEECLAVSPGAKFRNNLRSKVLKENGSFDPISVAKCYRAPNSNRVPGVLANKKSHQLEMVSPDLKAMLNSTSIIRGNCLEESRNYILQSLSPLLASFEMALYSQQGDQSGDFGLSRPNASCLQVVSIIKKQIHLSKPSFMLQWTILIAGKENDIDRNTEFQFSTIESQELVKRCFPRLVEEFVLAEKEEARQGSTEQERRRSFIQSMLKHDSQKTSMNQQARRRAKSRCDFPWKSKTSTTRNALPSPIRAIKTRKSISHMGGSNPETTLLSSFISLREDRKCGIQAKEEESPYHFDLTPGHLHYLGRSHHENYATLVGKDCASYRLLETLSERSELIYLESKIEAREVSPGDKVSRGHRVWKRDCPPPSPPNNGDKRFSMKEFADQAPFRTGCLSCCSIDTIRSMEARFNLGDRVAQEDVDAAAVRWEKRRRLADFEALNVGANYE